MYQQKSGKRKITITLICVLLFILVINLPVVRESAPSRLSRRILLNTIYPFQITFSFAFSKIGGAFGKVASLWGASSENSRLKAEISRLKVEISTLRDLAVENEELRGKIAFKNVNPYKFKLVPAEVVSRSPSNWFETVFINKGSRDGIAAGTAVLCEQGVVGRTVEVGRFSSKVMLITDPESSIGVFAEKSRELGIAVGGAMNSLQVKYVGAGSPISEGDQMLTSGMGGVFPKGIPVGIVTKTSARDFDLFKYVELKPLTDFAKLFKVYVIAK